MDIRLKIFLGGLFGILLGMAYAPFPSGITALVAFVPLFIVYERAERLGELLRFSYYAFFVYNLITLYWPGGFIHGKDTYLMLAGGILLLAHPLFYFVPLIAWHFIRKQFGFARSLIFFPVCWIAFEYFDSLTDFAFPWLTLGTTQAGDLAAIQFASLSGVYGVSFWLLSVNICIFLLGRVLLRKEWKLISPRTLLALVAVAALYTGPRIYGAHVLAREGEADKPMLRVGIIQPNIDPFEKWEQHTDPQVKILQDMTANISRGRPDLMLWPETALPIYLLDPRNAEALALVRRQVDSTGIPLLTGIPDIVYYEDSSAAPRGSKRLLNGVRYETFNGSVLIQPGSQKLQTYAKMLLVPFAERVPFSDILDFVNAARWNFGLGGWNKGRDVRVFRMNRRDGGEVRFSTMICYESIFPGFVARFAREGAEFLTVITNDSWWGNTSGPYQHVAIEALRAVETGRWLVQCSNGGISCVIDPNGRVQLSTPMFTRIGFTATVVPSSELTPYVRFGDWLPQLCVLISGTLLVGIFGKNIYINFINPERT